MIDAAVIDASVGIKLFVEEDGSAITDRLFSQLTGSPPAKFYVPDLFFIECANILWKYVRRFGYPADNARQDVRDLQALNLMTISTADLLVPAMELALSCDITAYDACYAALAQQINLPLITADSPLATKLEDIEIEVHLLADFDQ